MKQKIKIIGPQSGVSAEPKIGDKGYFWDKYGAGIIYGTIEGITPGQLKFERKEGGGRWRYFSRTLPPWFPVVTKVEDKPIELLSSTLEGAIQIELLKENGNRNGSYKDVCLLTYDDEGVGVDFCNWNSGKLLEG